MKLRWLGHACFLITTNGGTRIVIDPYDDSVGYGKLNVNADAAILSHSHHDHNYISAVNGAKQIIDIEGIYTVGDAKISTVLSFHDDANGKKRGMNLLTKIECDGETIVHLGDLGHMPNDSQLEFISNADALLIPVGGYYTIDTDTALRIAELAAPKAVIPMHYKNQYCDFPISGVEQFAEALNAVHVKDEETEITDMKGALVLPFAPLA